MGVDNINVNIGVYDFIKSWVLGKEFNVFVVGCLCYMLYNVVVKGVIVFVDVIGFDLEDYCVDLFYWFDKFIKRKGILKEYCEFCDIDYEVVVKYVFVRWFCLECCLDRELKKYYVLKFYFLLEYERDN